MSHPPPVIAPRLQYKGQESTGVDVVGVHNNRNRKYLCHLFDKGRESQIKEQSRTNHLGIVICAKDVKHLYLFLDLFHSELWDFARVLLSHRKSILAKFFLAEGRDNYLNVKKSPVFTIFRVITIKDKLFCHWEESKVTGGPVPSFSVPHFHRYWAIPKNIGG